MTSLNDYMQDVQTYFADQNQKYMNPEDLIRHVNRARREIAMRAGCVRVLTQSSGQVVRATITAAGTGYTNPVATITAPDFPDAGVDNPLGAQATASVIQAGGMITNIDITYGGSGYFQPQITITDDVVSPTVPGTGATATLTVTPITQTQNGQEVYPFENIPLDNFPGVGSVYFVNSISIIYAQYRYSLMTYSFSTYQALIRNYPLQYRYVPSICAQLKRGTNGDLYLYPVASQSYQLELDCYCLPQDLTDNESFEAIPGPWTDCVAFYAAHFAYLSAQNFNAADYYLKLYERKSSDYSSFASPRKVSNRYGRW